MSLSEVRSARQALNLIRNVGVGYVSGVPCSFLTPIINEAIAVSAAPWLAGRGCPGNTVNPITWLLSPFGIPAFIPLTWRGRGKIRDEPRRALTGRITPDLLERMDREWRDANASGFDGAAGLREAAAAAPAPTAATPQTRAVMMRDGVGLRLSQNPVDRFKGLVPRSHGPAWPTREARSCPREDRASITGRSSAPSGRLPLARGSLPRVLPRLTRPFPSASRSTQPCPF